MNPLLKEPVDFPSYEYSGLCRRYLFIMKALYLKDAAYESRAFLNDI